MDKNSTKTNQRLFHHALRFRQSVASNIEPAPPGTKDVQEILTRSITIVLEKIGFEGADLVAVESFRAEVEEYILHFVSAARRSMLACRRDRPIPLDFDQALRSMNVSTSSLSPHLKPPVSPKLSLPPIDSKQENDFPLLQQLPFLGSELNSDTARSKKYIPQHFPPFPSKHTYKQTPDYRTRESDSRDVREKATAEGRLGEDALRKLMGAHKANGINNIEILKQGKERGSTRVVGLEIWSKALAKCMELASVDQGNASAMEIDEGEKPNRQDMPTIRDLMNSPIVNYERQYWRKEAPKDRSNHKHKASNTASHDVVMTTS